MAEQPWLKSYDSEVPKTLQPYPAITFLDVLSDTVKAYPEHPALLFKGARMSYATLDRLSSNLAAALVAQGVRKGDRVVLLLPNSPQSLIGQFGIWKAGAITVPMNPIYAENELEHLLNECEAEIAIVLTSFYNKIKALQPRTKLRQIIATNIKEYLPFLLRVLFTLLKEKKEGHRITLQPGDLWLQELLKQNKNSPVPAVTVNPDDPALILFSGGTTGIPKGATGSHKALVIAGTQIHKWLSPTVKDRDDVIMQILPLFHVYGNVAVLATSLIGSNTVALVPNPRDLHDVVATVRKVRPAVFPAVPTLFIALLNYPKVKAGKVDFKSIKLCVSGAAPLLAETKREFEEVTGGRVVEGYGLTESMMGAIINPIKGEYKAGSIGLPLPDVDVRIVDIETGEKEVKLGEKGEIIMKAPQLMIGYWNSPEITAETIRNGWLHTGDVGYMDEDGYIFIIERKKDLIKASGYAVWPREVEEVIASVPAVAEVCCGGVPDDYRGETVKAWIKLREGQTCSAEEIISACREKMAPYKVPSQVEFREDFPKTMVGKVLRRVLVDEHKAQEEKK